MKLLVAAIFLLLILASCRIQKPISRQEADNNKTYNVQYLFEHDGCKVYRFYDRGRFVYFTNCRGEAISTTDSTTVRNSISVKP